MQPDSVQSSLEPDLLLVEEKEYHFHHGEVLMHSHQTPDLETLSMGVEAQLEVHESI